MADTDAGRLDERLLGRDTPVIPLGTPQGLNAPRHIDPGPAFGPRAPTAPATPSDG